MRISISVFLAAALAAAAQDVIIEHATVIPMRSETKLKDHSVLVRDGRIVKVGPASQVKAPAGALRVNGRGKFLIPGMGEMHGHIPAPSAGDAFIRDVLFLYVANGVTTVRGMLGHPGQLDLREKAAKNEIISPALYLAGPSFSGSSVQSVSQAEERVRQQKSEGWNLLKIHPGLTREQYDAIARTAKQVKIEFAGHVPAAVGLAHALAQGQQTIDHLDGFIEYMDAGATALQAAELTKKAGAWVVPTMVLWDTILGAADLKTLMAFPELKYMPRDQLAQWEKAYRARQSASQFDAAKVKHVSGERKRLLKVLDEQNVKMIFGTDSPQQYSVPGFSIRREAKAMAEAGMSPYRILRSATVSVGEYFRSEGSFGTLSEGSRADAVLLHGDPLQNIENVGRIAGVLVRGRWMPDSEIQSGLDRIAQRNGGR